MAGFGLSEIFISENKPEFIDPGTSLFPAILTVKYCPLQFRLVGCQFINGNLG